MPKTTQTRPFNPFSRTSPQEVRDALRLVSPDTMRYFMGWAGKHLRFLRNVALDGGGGDCIGELCNTEGFVSQLGSPIQIQHPRTGAHIRGYVLCQPMYIPGAILNPWVGMKVVRVDDRKYRKKYGHFIIVTHPNAMAPISSFVRPQKTRVGMVPPVRFLASFLAHECTHVIFPDTGMNKNEVEALMSNTSPTKEAESAYVNRPSETVAFASQARFDVLAGVARSRLTPARALALSPAYAILARNIPKPILASVRKYALSL